MGRSLASEMEPKILIRATFTEARVRIAAYHVIEAGDHLTRRNHCHMIVMEKDLELRVVPLSDKERRADCRFVVSGAIPQKNVRFLPTRLAFHLASR
jgi:hypothetical protein